MSGWPRVRLGDVLKHVPRPVGVEFEREYREIGIRSHGKGLFHKAPVLGSQLGDKRVFHVEPGDFILNIVFAWEGAVGLVSEAERGMIASHRFPTFRSDEQRIDLRFLVLFFRTPKGIELLGQVSPGGAGRNRTLSRSAFLSLQIPLPSLTEQQRLVTRIAELGTELAAAKDVSEQASAQSEALFQCAALRLFARGSSHLVGNFVRFQTGYAFKSEWFADDGIRLVRNANVGHGRLDWADCVRLPSTMRGAFSRFELREGDILIALDRPVISTGVKAARVATCDLPALLLQRVARATVDGDKLSPDYFFRWLHCSAFAEGINPGRSNGVPHISHKDVERLPIRVPALADQQRIVVEFDALQVQVNTLKATQAASRAELDALMPAVLDRAFAGLL